MNINKLLNKMGLNENAVQVYLALLATGATSVAKIARVAHLERPTVYTTLPYLMDKHLVARTTVGKRAVYAAEDPERLRGLLAELDDALTAELPTLKKNYATLTHEPKTRYFQGETAATWVYEDVLATLKKGDVFYRYESPKDYKQLDEYLPPAYFERVCKKKEIEKFVITNERTMQTKPKVLERISHAVPAKFDAFEYDITQIVYASKVAFLDFESKTAWITEHPRFAKFQRQIFRLLFEKLSKNNPPL